MEGEISSLRSTASEQMQQLTACKVGAQGLPKLHESLIAHLCALCAYVLYDHAAADSMQGGCTGTAKTLAYA
jgi:hypothetical protein